MQGAELTASRIRFEPGLEGLRGLLLPAVLCFHAEFSWAVGGFLALPTFFTLSGFLITSLFLVEWERSANIRVIPFWGRRFRRLMPALLLTLGSMSLFAAFVATPDQLERLHADVLWSLFYLANWHFVLSDASYLELFAAPSPVQHFWSLAVEEQFYFLYPLLALAVLRLARGSRVVFGGVLAALVLASVADSVLLRVSGASIDRIYYGSDTRGAELFLGALLATLLCGRVIDSSALRRLVTGVGAAALAGMLALWASVRIEEEWIYEGGFAAYSLLSVAVIAAAVQPDGPVRALLSGRILGWLGRISYGAYLFHWPIYLWLSEDRTGLSPWPLLVLRSAVTLILAEASYRFIESPIRSRRALRGWRPWVATPLAFVAVAASITLTAGALARERDASSANEPDLERYMETLSQRRESGELDSDRPPAPDAEVPRVAVFGDSTGFAIAIPLLFHLESTGMGRASLSVAELGCGLMRKGIYRVRKRKLTRPEHCVDRDEAWAEAIARGNPDIAVVSEGPWEVGDRKLPDDEQWRHVGDPVLDAYLRQEMLGAVDLLAARGTRVIWLTSPDIELRQTHTGRPPNPPYPGSDPARMARFNELVSELPTLRPGLVRVVDLAAYMRARPNGPLDPDYRPDGTHLSGEGGLKLAREWLADELMRVYRDQGRAAPSQADPPTGDLPE
jgi:peptidoglycan/LPS O-acetylase OafA/YrhL